MQQTPVKRKNVYATSRARQPLAPSVPGEGQVGIAPRVGKLKQTDPHSVVLPQPPPCSGILSQRPGIWRAGLVLASSSPKDDQAPGGERAWTPDLWLEGGECLRREMRVYRETEARVVTLHHASATSGFCYWDLRNKEGLPVAYGLYLYVVETPEGRTHRGKFAVIR